MAQAAKISDVTLGFRKIVQIIKEFVTQIPKTTDDLEQGTTNKYFTTQSVTDIVTPLLNDKVLTNDSRLSDARVPLAHTHTVSDITDLNALIDARVAAYIATLPTIPVPDTSGTNYISTEDGTILTDEAGNILILE